MCRGKACAGAISQYHLWLGHESAGGSGVDIKFVYVYQLWPLRKHGARESSQSHS